MNGSGTLTLSAANTYGDTTVSSGVVQLNNASALGSGLLTINGGLVALQTPTTMSLTLGSSAGNLRVTGGTGRVIAAGSRVDNATTDPSTIEMSGGGRVGTYLCRLARSDSSVSPR